MIGFIGSVFSPYYALARRKGPTDPEIHCAINVALYGRNKRWCMTERGRKSMRRNETELVIGPSSMTWRGNELVIQVNEISVPVPRRVIGEIRLRPTITTAHVEQLDALGQHFWHPAAPLAEVSVAFDQPRFAWAGSGYHDVNWGAVPLEQSFNSWTWSRAAHGTGASVVYDVERRDGVTHCFGLGFSETGISRFDPPPCADLGTAFWRMPRVARSEGPAVIAMPLEDAPFYTRSLIRSRLFGQAITSFHESLSLARFRLPIVQAMLPFRMPRRP